MAKRRPLVRMSKVQSSNLDVPLLQQRYGHARSKHVWIHALCDSCGASIFLARAPKTESGVPEEVLANIGPLQVSIKLRSELPGDDRPYIPAGFTMFTGDEDNPVFAVYIAPGEICNIRCPEGCVVKKPEGDEVGVIDACSLK